MASWLTVALASHPLRDRLDAWGLTPARLFWLSAALFVVMLLGSLAFVTLILVKLPADYFAEAQRPPAFAWEQRHPAVRWTVLVAKNVAGVLLLVLGVILSLPLIPGQGLLTIIIGLMLLNFPGKRRLERKLVSRPRVTRAINRLRARFGKPPLVPPRLPRPAGPREAT